MSVSVCLSVCDGSALWSLCMPGRGEGSCRAMLATARPSCLLYRRSLTRCRRQLNFLSGWRCSLPWKPSHQRQIAPSTSAWWRRSQVRPATCRWPQPARWASRRPRPTATSTVLTSCKHRATLRRLIYHKNFPLYNQVYDRLLGHSSKTAKIKTIAQFITTKHMRWVLHLNVVIDRFKCYSACVLWL